MNTINKLLSYLLLGAILATGCFAASLTTIQASVMVSFGKSPVSDADIKEKLASYISVSAATIPTQYRGVAR